MTVFVRVEVLVVRIVVVTGFWVILLVVVTVAILVVVGFAPVVFVVVVRAVTSLYTV